MWVRILLFKPIKKFRQNLRQHANVLLFLYDALEKDNLMPVIRLDAISDMVSASEKPKAKFDIFLLQSYVRVEVKTTRGSQCIIKKSQVASDIFYLFVFLRKKLIYGCWGKQLKTIQPTPSKYNGLVYKIKPEFFINPPLGEIRDRGKIVFYQPLTYDFLKTL